MNENNANGAAVNEAKSSKGKLVKIIVPIAIVIVIAAIFIIRNIEDSRAQAEIAEQAANSAFPLNISTVDLDTMTAANMPIIIDFGADECVPCVEMAPVLETLNAEMQGKAIIQFVDVWKNPEAATGFPVQVIPTQVIFTADGEPYVPSADLGIELAYAVDQDTEEHLFTVHQGGLTEEQMRAILSDMGVS